MKVLVLGAAGQLGRELVRVPRSSATQVIGHDREWTDIAAEGAVAKALEDERPDILVNAAAYTAVDFAEKEPEKAFAINAAAVKHIGEACAARHVPVVHVSTDYVFDGQATRPYTETDPPGPMGVYGASKLEGEIALRHACPQHLILRTAWVYSKFGNNFVKTMLRLGRERGQVRVVADQLGSPTSAADIARAIMRLVEGGLAAGVPYGTYHLTNSGTTSWHGFAEAIFQGLYDREKVRVEAVPITSAEYPTPARRPAYSVLDNGLLDRNFGIRLRPWTVALEDVLDEIIGPRGR